MSFSEHNINGLVYLTSDKIEPVHAFTTRYGGVSEGIYSSLNLRVFGEDSSENIRINYDRLCDALDMPLERMVYTKQVHGTEVRAVTEKDSTGLFQVSEYECDGLVTNVPDVPLIAYTADCIPVLLYDPVKKAAGAVHAGWRGSVAGIAARAVEAMQSRYGAKPEHIRAAIGPNIGPCCFETHNDVPDALRALLGAQAERFIEKRGSKFHVDLKGANRLVLERAGVRNVDVSDHCTACRQDLYWSHRVTGLARGSLAAIIQCPKGGRE